MKANTYHSAAYLPPERAVGSIWCVFISFIVLGYQVILCCKIVLVPTEYNSISAKRTANIARSHLAE